MEKRKYKCLHCGKVVTLNEKQSELATKAYTALKAFELSLYMKKRYHISIADILNKCFVECCEHPMMSWQMR